jgi:uncharacterized membrane protein
VKAIRVRFVHELYPVAKESPEVVVILKVVPAGGLTKPIDANKVVDELNPFNTNPLPS